MHTRWLLVATLLTAGCDRLFNLQRVNSDGSTAIDDIAPERCAPRSVATGREHTCSVDYEGRVYCWGLNDSGQVAPSSDTYRVFQPSEVLLPGPATKVVAGRPFSCALLETGEVWCWGNNFSGALGVAADPAVKGPVQVLAPAAMDISAGAYHACIRTADDASVWCWGRNHDQETGQPTSLTSLPALVLGTTGTKVIELGHRHSCVINSNDQTACWGRNHSGQLGDTGPSRGAPTLIAGLGPSTAVSAAGQTACALATTGTVRCWGVGSDGQLGNGAFADSMMPLSTSITDATTISVGGFGSCALRPGGVVSCWGSHEVGDGVSSTTNVPRMANVSGVTQVATSFFHTCAIANNDIACWGNDAQGQLGRGDRGVVTTLQAVPFSEQVTQVVAGSTHVCALGASKQVYCWGENDYAEGTNAQLETLYTPTIINPNITGVSTLVAAYEHTCAISAATSKATCWGKAYFGGLGTGAQQRHVAIPAGVQTATVTRLALGYQHMCTLDVIGAVRCYGDNRASQLGAASPSTSAIGITPINGSATEIATGERFSCAIVATSIQCWGANESGQLGDNSTINRPTPTPVALTAGFDQIGAGREFACARQISTGSVYCWGNNTNGELGLGMRSEEPVSIPQKVVLPPTSIVTDLWVGYASACAKLTSGVVYCWGDSDEGQAGTGSESDVLTPTAIPSEMGATSIALGTHGVCFVTGGQLRCAGDRRMLGTDDNSRSLPARPGLPSCN